VTKDEKVEGNKVDELMRVARRWHDERGHAEPCLHCCTECREGNPVLPRTAWFAPDKPPAR